MAPTPDSDGYWLVTAKGAVHADSGAQRFGSLAETDFGTGVVDNEATSSGEGYRIALGDSDIHLIGDAKECEAPSMEVGD